MLLAFHGGGDSAFYISYISGWAEIAHKHNFLLVAVEHHLNSTATEMVELVAIWSIRAAHFSNGITF